MSKFSDLTKFVLTGVASFVSGSYFQHHQAQTHSAHDRKGIEEEWAVVRSFFLPHRYKHNEEAQKLGRPVSNPI